MSDPNAKTEGSRDWDKAWNIWTGAGAQANDPKAPIPPKHP